MKPERQEWLEDKIHQVMETNCRFSQLVRALFFPHHRCLQPGFLNSGCSGANDALDDLYR